VKVGTSQRRSIAYTKMASMAVADSCRRRPRLIGCTRSAFDQETVVVSRKGHRHARGAGGESADASQPRLGPSGHASGQTRRRDHRPLPAPRAPPEARVLARPRTSPEAESGAHPAGRLGSRSVKSEVISLIWFEFSHPKSN
jgi:hypothetical protein